MYVREKRVQPAALSRLTPLLLRQRNLLEDYVRDRQGNLEELQRAMIPLPAAPATEETELEPQPSDIPEEMLDGNHHGASNSPFEDRSHHTEAPKLFRDWASTALEFRTEKLPEIQKEYGERLSKLPDHAAAVLARLAAYHRLSQACLDDIVRGFLPLLQSQVTPLLTEIAASGTVLDAAELWAQAVGVKLSSVSPRIITAET